MVGNLGRNSLQKCFHLCRNLIQTVHDTVIYHIRRNDFFSWQSGNTVNSYNLTYFLFRITEASHDHLKPLGSPCADLQIISFTYFTADRFIHLSASQRYFPADNDLSSGDDRYFCTLCTDIYDHISFRIFQIDTHGNGICNGCLYHKYAIFL